ncbi:MAG TPA: GIY-YIG nuclease family protein [Candidatus Paceibacterota bacterium]|nr:GIY-YIG nuclease family protein [Patescibacteria group bacterium]
MWYVYILRCRDGSLYIGMTWNVEKRLWEHNTRIGALYTRNRLPVKLVYYEEFRNKFDAARREKEIKGWRREKKEDLITGFQGLP